MDRIQTEKKVERLMTLRSKRQKLNKEIDKVTDGIKLYMKQQNINKIRMQKYSVQLLHRKSRSVDYNQVEKAISEGKLSDTVIKQKEFEMLKIVSDDMVKLEGNKFAKSNTN